MQESRAGYVGSLGCLHLGSLGNSARGAHAFPLVESGEDYVNVPESEESAEASLNGSREYVNVSQELQPGAKTKPDTQNSQEVEDEEAPDYENL